MGHDTIDANLELGFAADDRSYDRAAAILQDLGIAQLRLMPNNPQKVASLASHGLDNGRHVPHEGRPQMHNPRHLRTKARRLSHVLSFVGCHGFPLLSGS